ncbi:urease accessory protein UreD [Pseudanabaena galeata UHCC 0370]|jgi:urease accessory protein|uniref:Urease accessory protein UreD n=1 Tax=Pseudanabaena galeata UHCC 0370 TaxID=3110310 RepID=A0ABU5TF76_9CYAN|nr:MULTISPECIES: urease accessory protein UreD [Pseudanabaena]MEA5476912.1 urease accessory protein UreD [Pseudanabaena galeata UHCC 0370]MEA5485384.1 urease accessory protein UreD [Pseudanabaena sp. CCNP1317]WGS73603.1 urease accessory protein UreD [Pseudanabaena galeata CCNP1313]
MVAPWAGELELEFAKRHQQTLLARSYTVAPWRIQRSLYPEGEEVCHCILLHTAGGLVGGDRLSAKIHLQPHTQALITTATASKIYRSTGAESLQNIHIRIDEGASLEWFPQETIAFAEAKYRQTTRIDLASEATCTLWEIVRFGRTARGEKFLDGNWRSHTEVWRDQTPLWIDRQYLNGNSEMLGSPNGLNNYAIAANFIFVGKTIEPELINCIRSTWEQGNYQGVSGVTRSLTGLVCRYFGDSSSDARKWFQQIWQLLRVSYRNRTICVPRVW